MSQSKYFTFWSCEKTSEKKSPDVQRVATDTTSEAPRKNAALW